MTAAQLRAASANVAAISEVVVEIPGDNGTVAVVKFDSWQVEHLIGAARGDPSSRLILHGRMAKVNGPNAASVGLTELREPAA